MGYTHINEKLVNTSLSNTSYTSSFNILSSSSTETNALTNLDYVNNIFFSGIDWIYCTTETILSYDFKVWYLFDELTNLNDSSDIFFDQYWFASLSISTFQLFYAVILDKYLSTTLHYNSFNSDWFKFLLHSKENTFIWLYHPELSWHFNSVNTYLTFFYSGMFDFVYLNKTTSEKLLSSYTLFTHLIFLFFLISIFISLLFTYYGNPNTEENTIDSDYLAASGTVEAEKEIASIDDYLGLVFIFAYIFGIFFYIHAWTIAAASSPMMITFYSLFIIFIFVLGMPTMILYDLGIFFLAYLKGAGKNKTFLFECIFDYLACIVFYTRILAQWIRIVLMLVTFMSLSHYVAEFDITNNVLIMSENQSDNMNELTNYTSSTYYILTVLPGKFLYWMYEILHTLFLVSSQFIAFFAIVFWLFLFLYTFFISEKHEDFFSKKRIERKNLLKNLYALKN